MTAATEFSLRSEVMCSDGACGEIRQMGGVGNAAPQTITEDRVSEGDVEVRRGEHVQATDGEIGRIYGFVIDPADHGLTHVIVDEGHLCGHETIAIPISAHQGYQRRRASQHHQGRGGQSALSGVAPQ